MKYVYNMFVDISDSRISGIVKNIKMIQKPFESLPNGFFFCVCVYLFVVG